MHKGVGTDEKITEHMEPLCEHSRTLRAGHFEVVAAFTA